MAMIVQLILLLRFCVDVDVSGVIVGLLTGEDSSTTADDVTTNVGDRKTMLLLSYPRRRRHHSSQPRTISTRKVRMRYGLSPTLETSIYIVLYKYNFQ